MNPFPRMVSELRERHLLPVAILLLAAIVAVPVALSKTAAPAPPPPAVAVTAAVPGASALPAVSVRADVPTSRLTGWPHDPFNQGNAPSSQVPGAVTTSAAVSSTASGVQSTTAVSHASQTGSGSAGGSSAAAGGGAPASTVPSTGTQPHPTIPLKPVPPATAQLGPREVYRVAVTLTTPAGGLNTIDPLERLSVLPSERQPLLVELGVLKGGNRVLFALQPGASVQGPGECIPGPVACELLSLAPNQVEAIDGPSASGTTEVARFAVTGIGVGRLASAAAARQARAMVSSAGARVLAATTIPALSLFSYDPSQGAVLDLRNVFVGGS